MSNYDNSSVCADMTVTPDTRSRLHRITTKVKDKKLTTDRKDQLSNLGINDVLLASFGSLQLPNRPHYPGAVDLHESSSNTLGEGSLGDKDRMKVHSPEAPHFLSESPSQQSLPTSYSEGKGIPSKRVAVEKSQKRRERASTNTYHTNPVALFYPWG